MAAAANSRPDLIAIDCEMIGNKRMRGISYLAHVGIVDASGNVLLDKYIKKPVDLSYNNINYRTQFSGITKPILESATDSFSTVQKEVERLLEGKTVVGHALENDFKALRIDRSKYKIIDTAYTPVFMQLNRDKLQPKNLKKLADELLNKKIQTTEHNALEDAQTAMELVLKYEKHIDTPAEVVISTIQKAEAIKAAKLNGGSYTRRRKYRYKNKTMKHR